MDLAPEQLQYLTISEIVKESISIPKSSPKLFSLITLTLIFPLSFAIVAHSLFTHPLVQQIQNETSPYSIPTPESDSNNSNLQSTYTLLLTYQFTYLIFLFAFSLLSTAAVVFTVASLYTSKPVSFSSTLSALPPVLKRLFVTFIYVSFLMVLYNLVFIACLLVLIFALYMQNLLLFMFAFFIVLVMFLGVHMYITALWHLASVITVLEPVAGIAAMRKSKDLLHGKTQMAMTLVFGYLTLCGIIGSVFGSVVVHGEDYGYGAGIRVVVGGFLVVVLVLVNLIGLLVQSVFYYVCKSYHHQGIDKSALNDHLGGYLGEYVPLKSSIQMESL